MRGVRRHNGVGRRGAPRFIVRCAPLAGLLCVALVGCGGSSGSPKSTIESFYSAVADGNGGRACSLLTSSAQDEAVAKDKVVATGAGRSAPTDCEGAIKDLQEPDSSGSKLPLSDLRFAAVTDVQERGDKAVAQVRIGQGAAPVQVEVGKDGGGWKLTAFPDLLP